jgi:hypothetical protein
LKEPVIVDPTPVLELVDVPEFLFGDAFLYTERLRPEELHQSERRRRQRIPGPTEFAISLIAYVNATSGKCPLCDYEEDEKTSDEEEEGKD